MSSKKVIELSSYGKSVIHFAGGMKEYIGEPGLGFGSTHKNGVGWYRVLKPCVIMQDAKGTIFVAAIQGDQKLYKRFVDIYCPPDSLMEIKVLNPEGELYKRYMKERDREPSNLIIPAGTNIH